MTYSRSRVSLALLAGGAVIMAGAVSAQGWKPERPVELTVPSGPGGSNDNAARVIHKLWADLNLVPVATSVVNRPGGGHNVAYTAVSQRTGDPHFLGVMSTPLLMNYVGGRSPLNHNDLTPLAYVITEPMVVAVRTESPIKTAQELIDALKKNSASVSIALTSLGHRVSIGLPLRKAGVEFKGVRMPTFKSGGETSTAVIGGHADVLITSVSTLVPHLQSGTMRALAVTSSKRLAGPFASVPTWQELGYQSSGSWKGVMAPKGITPAQIAFWEDVMRKTAQSDAMREYAGRNQWLIEYKNAAETRRWMDEEAVTLKAVLTELGYAKK